MLKKWSENPRGELVRNNVKELKLKRLLMSENGTSAIEQKARGSAMID